MFFFAASLLSIGGVSVGAMMSHLFSLFFGEDIDIPSGCIKNSGNMLTWTSHRRLLIRICVLFGTHSRVCTLIWPVHTSCSYILSRQLLIHLFYLLPAYSAFSQQSIFQQMPCRGHHLIGLLLSYFRSPHSWFIWRISGMAWPYCPSSIVRREPRWKSVAPCHEFFNECAV